MNFDFLKNIADLQPLYSNCNTAECIVHSNPSISAVASRSALEFAVKLIYQAKVGPLPEVYDLCSLCKNPYFTCLFQENTLKNIAYVRKIGNDGTHTSSLDTNKAMTSLKALYYVLSDMLLLMGYIEKALPKFQEGALDTVPVTPVEPPKAVDPEPELVSKVAKRLKEVVFCFEENANEEENKRLAFEGTLYSSGWNSHAELNLLVPNSVNPGVKLIDGTVADFIMTDDANFPIAVIDFNESVNNPIAGRKKVLAQMAALEKQYGKKVAGYYSNGYMTMFLDPCGSPARRVYSYHKTEELKRIIARASERQDIHQPNVDATITNRKPIIEAVQEVCNVYNDNKRRKSVVVIATGVGKTRLSIALTDILIKNYWATRILFLADRTSLVKQACKAFKQCLPHLTTSEFIGDNIDKDTTAKVILSTYQTMFSLIEPDTKPFGIGHFDLIIVDEAHRSIFNKYKLLFDYFDAFMLGLTATPRDEDSRSTYDVFDMPSLAPDYEYNLADAVTDGYLVGFEVVDRTTERIHKGIRYADLSPEDREKIENEFGDDTEALFHGSQIDARYVGKRVIDVGTIKTMLSDLMCNGIKINGGDSIGKTIIFAKSVMEASAIVDTFRALFPQYGHDYIDRIDATIPTAQSILDHFAVRDTMPMIAVSVDMLDTGVDVPDIVNLVFFKIVHSKIKFIQMIGRGTRTSKDLFGPSLDKKEFLIFDYYDNFRYFDVVGMETLDNPNKKDRSGRGGSNSLSSSGYIYWLWTRIMGGLQARHSSDPFEVDYEKHLRESLNKVVLELNNEITAVSHELAFVNKYRKASSWLNLTKEDIYEIRHHIIPLLPPLPDSAKVKAFDILMYSVQAIEAEKGDVPNATSRFGFDTIEAAFNTRAKWLLRSTNIPAVKAKENEIVAMKDGKSVLDNYSLASCESIRKDLRHLMDFLPDDKRFVIIETNDSLMGDDGSLTTQPPYEERAMKYISENRDTDLALIHLFTLEPLTDDDKNHLTSVFEGELGSTAEFLQWCNGVPKYAFLRSKVGIDEGSIVTKFGDFYKDPSVLNPVQQLYIDAMIDYARANGDITAVQLQASPFTDIAPQVMSVFGNNLKYVKKVLDTIHDAIK